MPDQSRVKGIDHCAEDTPEEVAQASERAGEIPTKAHDEVVAWDVKRRCDPTCSEWIEVASELETDEENWR